MFAEDRSAMDCCNRNSSDSVDSTDRDVRVCHGCKLQIEDRYTLQVSPDLEWHCRCLVCCECHEYLDENCQTCFIKEGRLYCRRDYFNLFGVKCGSCGDTIHANTLVMRAKKQVFHTQCFRCVTCEKMLTSGEEYGIASGKLYCKADYDTLPLEMINSPTVDTSTGHRKSNSEKQPRVRTVLTEQQLATLRSVYSTNPRPDALLKEQLCEVTGLSPRVIRVWFQNRRCKDKKKALQAEAARMQSMQTGKQVLPMTPQAPVTPDNMSQVSPHGPMAVFTYPSAVPGYEHLSPQLNTSIATSCVSPVVSMQHTAAWGSPTDTISAFEHTVDFHSPITSDPQQNYAFSTIQPHIPQPTPITHFQF